MLTSTNLRYDTKDDFMMEINFIRLRPLHFRTYLELEWYLLHTTKAQQNLQRRKTPND